MTPWLTADDARAILVRRIQESGSAEIFAWEAGVSPALVSFVLNGKKAIGPKLATALGLIAAPVRVHRYRVRGEQ